MYELKRDEAAKFQPPCLYQDGRRVGCIIRWSTGPDGEVALQAEDTNVKLTSENCDLRDAQVFLSGLIEPGGCRRHLRCDEPRV